MDCAQDDCITLSYIVSIFSSGGIVRAVWISLEVPLKQVLLYILSMKAKGDRSLKDYN